MKITTTADWHLGNSNTYGLLNANGVNDFLIEKYNIAKKIISTTKKNKGHLILAGDFIDSTLIDSVTLNFSSDLICRMDKLRLALLLEGNHGYDGRNNKYSAISHWDHFTKNGLRIISKPDVVEKDNIIYHCIPTINDVERLFPAIVSDFWKTHSRKKSHKYVLVFHGPIVDAKWDNGKKNTIGVKRKYISKASNLYDYIVCGDFHRYQWLNKNTWYTGSTIQESLKDKKQRKGCQIIDTESNKVSFINSNSFNFIEAEWVVGESICPILKRPELFRGTLNRAIVIIKLKQKFKDEIDLDYMIKSLLDNGVYRIFVDQKIKENKKKRIVISSNISGKQMVTTYVEQNKQNLPADINKVISRGILCLTR